MKTKPSIVFAHGLWADGSCLSKVITPLQAEGYEVMASQHSLDSVKGDVATVKRTLGRVSSPAILVWATHMVPVADLFEQKVEGTAWKSKPSWYIVATKDRTVHPELQRFAAKRMGATTYECESSHVPMLSNPNLVLDVIRTAAKSVKAG